MAAKTKTLVRDVMTAHPICVSRSDSLQEVADLLDQNGISGAPVVDEHDRVIGVVSKTDILRRALEGPLGAELEGPLSSFLGLAAGSRTPLDPNEFGVAEDFMSEDLITAAPDEPLAAVADRMAIERVHRLVVVDEKRKALGMITTLDVLKHFPSGD